MDDSEFWLKIWRTAGVTLSVIALSGAGCTMHKNAVKSRALAASVDPLALSCAWAESERENAICLTLAARRQNP